MNCNSWRGIQDIMSLYVLMSWSLDVIDFADCRALRRWPRNRQCNSVLPLPASLLFWPQSDIMKVNQRITDAE